MPRPYAKRKVFELSERLNALDEFKALPLIQERICFEHINNPDYTKEDIARKLGVSSADVYAFFHSEKWEVINTELAKQQIRELVQLAIKTLHECLKDRRGNVKLQAATTILTNAKLLEKEPKSVKQDNKLVVVWNENKQTGDISDPRMGELNGNSYPLCAASETSGSPRIEG